MSTNIDFGVLIEPVARRLFGEPNARLSNAAELRFGTNGSLSVVVAGIKRGTWFDHESGQGGGVLDLSAKTQEVVEKRCLRLASGRRLVAAVGN